MERYRRGYYDGWLAALAMIDTVSLRHLQQMERVPDSLDEDGFLNGYSVSLAHGYAQEACERYAYNQLQTWCGLAHVHEDAPPFPEQVVDAATGEDKPNEAKRIQE